MRARPRLLLFGGSATAQAPLVARLGAMFELQVEPSFAAALSDVDRLAPEVVAADLRGAPELALQVLEKLHRARPELPLVALHDQKDPDLILQAMHAGAREFVLLDVPSELERVFGELARRGGERRQSGTVISVFSPKGGLGATTVATNLAGALLDPKRRVVLVDLDFEMGDALVFLDLASRYSITDVLANQHRLDGELLIGSLTRHASGLYVLAQPELVGQAEEQAPADVTRLLGFLVQHFDDVVVDGLHGFDGRSVAALDASRRVLLVTAQNVPAVRNAHRALELFRRLGYAANKVSLVVNRWSKGEEISAEDISQNLGLPVEASLANDYRTVMAAVNKGQLLKHAAPRARITDDFRKLALSLTAPAEAREASAGFLKSLFGSRGKEEGHGPERSSEAV